MEVFEIRFSEYYTVIKELEVQAAGEQPCLWYWTKTDIP